MFDLMQIKIVNDRLSFNNKTVMNSLAYYKKSNSNERY